MITKNKEVYYCEHCRKHGLNKGAMKHHENICSKNPVNDRPCFHCKHLGYNDAIAYGSYYGEENAINRTLLYCNKRDVFLYTPQNEIKGNQYDLGDDMNERMPKICLQFEKRDLGY